jgi:hypothetical protein
MMVRCIRDGRNKPKFDSYDGRKSFSSFLDHNKDQSLAEISAIFRQSIACQNGDSVVVARDKFYRWVLTTRHVRT